MMNYYTIPAELEPFVQSIWSFESPAVLNKGEQAVVIPSGNWVLLWNYKGEYMHRMNNVHYVHPLYDLHLVGQTMVKIDLLGYQPVSSLGVSFKPFGFYAFVGSKLKDYTNTVVSLDKSTQEGKTVLAHFSGCITEAVNELTTFLIEKLAFIPDPRVVTLVEEIERHKGSILIKELFSKVEGSQRHLNKLFTTQVGLTPKAFSSLVRFHCLYNCFIRDGNMENKADLYEYYFDESHFIHSFKGILATQPRLFLKAPNALGNQFIKK